MQIVVLGMHRSGTSMFTRLVNMMGAYFGPEYIATKPNAENPKGFWERRDVRKLNDMLLLSVGKDWNRIADYDPLQLPDDARATFNLKARILIDRLDAHRPFVIKEPRLCVNLPAWLPLLECPVFLICTRHPIEIARSLQARNGIPLPVGISLTQAYLRRLLRATEGYPRAVYRHRDLMSDPADVAKRVHSQLRAWGVRRLTVPAAAEINAFIDPRLHRHHTAPAEQDAYLSPMQAAFFHAVDTADWDTLAPMLDVSEPEATQLRLYESGLSSAEHLKRAQKKLEQSSIELRNSLEQISQQQHELERHVRQLDRQARQLEHKDRDLKQLSDRYHDLQAALSTSKDRVRVLEEQHARTLCRLDRDLRALLPVVEGLQRSRSWRFGHALVLTGARLCGRAAGNGFDVLRPRLERTLGLIGALGPIPSESHTPLPRDLPPASHQSPSSVKTAVVGPVVAAPPSSLAHFPIASCPRATSQTAPTPQVAPQRRSGITVAVIAWEASHNSLGRAYLLAETLARHFNVILVGFGFDRYGHDVWSPLRNAPIPTIRIPGSDFPAFADTLAQLAPRIEADAIIACKPRIPSLQLGLLMKAFLNRPLLIDIDDWELSFFRERSPIARESLASLRNACDFTSPFQETWTRFAESLVPLGDAILVSNEALQQRFGGHWIPHARDERIFDPAHYDRDAVRRKFGYGPEHRVVLFLGTPRRHKGVLEVARVVSTLEDPNHRFCIIGDFPDQALELELRAVGGERLQMVSGQPFSQLAENVLVGDVVCVLQDPEHETSKFQLPAKVVDALAMGIPVVATDTVPLRPLIRAGVIDAVTRDDLATVLARTLDTQDAQARQAQRRSLFLRDYSYAAIGNKLQSLIVKLLRDGVEPLAPEHLSFVQLQKSVLASPMDLTPRASSAQADGAVDVVMFWKQNDSHLYGRRVDMLAKYFARSPRVRRVLVIDLPIERQRLAAMQGGTDVTHDRRVFVESWRKNWRLVQADNISYHLFVYSDAQADPEALWKWPAQSDYFKFLHRLFAEYNINPDRAAFFVYPKNEYILTLARRFRPKTLIADIVDDHRTWPGLNQEQVTALTRHYRDVVRSADLVVANCNSMKEAMEAFDVDVHIVTNACETEPPPKLIDSRECRWLRGLNGPKLGYVGNLEAKIDIQLLDFLASQRRDWHVVLIGSTHARPEVLTLDRHPNVHFLGVIPYPEVRGWIAEFDVALIPHLDTPQTRAMNPLKLYVYAALGVPIVAKSISNISDLEECVSIADTNEAFVTLVDEALKRRRQRGVLAQTDSLEANCWTSRIRELFELIDRYEASASEGDWPDASAIGASV